MEDSRAKENYEKDTRAGYPAAALLLLRIHTNGVARSTLPTFCSFHRRRPPCRLNIYGFQRKGTTEFAFYIAFQKRSATRDATSSSSFSSSSSSPSCGVSFVLAPKYNRAQQRRGREKKERKREQREKTRGGGSAWVMVIPRTGFFAFETRHRAVPPSAPGKNNRHAKYVAEGHSVSRRERQKLAVARPKANTLSFVKRGIRRTVRPSTQRGVSRISSEGEFLSRDPFASPQLLLRVRSRATHRPDIISDGRVASPAISGCKHSLELLSCAEYFSGVPATVHFHMYTQITLHNNKGVKNSERNNIAQSEPWTVK